MKEVVTYSAEIQGLHNTYFFLVEVIFRQFFKTTAAALTCAAHAAVLYFVLYYLSALGGKNLPAQSPPPHGMLEVFFVIFQ